MMNKEQRSMLIREARFWYAMYKIERRQTLRNNLENRIRLIHERLFSES